MKFSYKAYCADNPQKLWFKRKPYGWGWVPVTKEGWLVILGFLVWVSSAIYLFLPAHPVRYIGALALGIGILIRICYAKGEKPCWQWGK